MGKSSINTLQSGYAVSLKEIDYGYNAVGQFTGVVDNNYGSSDKFVGGFHADERGDVAFSKAWPGK